jgi:selenocysteine lyase/cysteine desulfurase
LVRVHGPRDRSDCGATVALDVCDPRGTAIPYAAVEARAREAGVAVRGGCFCNPGAAEAAALASRMLGAVRFSLGLATNRRDIDRAIAVVRSFTSSG